MHPELIGDELTKYVLLKRIGIMREVPKDAPERFETRHAYDAYIQKMYDGLNSAMTQLTKAGQLKFTERYQAATAKGLISLSAKQIESYNAVLDSCLKKYNVTNTWQIAYTKQTKEFYKELDDNLFKKLKFKNVKRLLKIEKGAEYDLDAFKANYPVFEGMPKLKPSDLDEYILMNSEDNFWMVISMRVSEKHEKGVGVGNSKYYDADILAIRKGKKTDKASEALHDTL